MCSSPALTRTPGEVGLVLLGAVIAVSDAQIGVDLGNNSFLLVIVHEDLSHLMVAEYTNGVSGKEVYNKVGKTAMDKYDVAWF